MQFQGPVFSLTGVPELHELAGAGVDLQAQRGIAAGGTSVRRTRIRSPIGAQARGKTTGASVSWKRYAGALGVSSGMDLNPAAA